MIKSALPDQEARELAVFERDRNVIVDAGAGTGKTGLIVKRIVELVAPSRDHAPVPIERIAAVTFTRRAAGELRLRIRSALIERLDIRARDEELIRRALSGLDTACIGTIHSLADHLLRLKPREARLSAEYDVVEDSAELVSETLDLVLRSAEDGSLSEVLGERVDESLAEEAEETVRDLRRCGLRVRDRETDHGTFYGIEGLVSAVVRNRDVTAAAPDAVEFDLESFRRFARELIDRVRPLRAGSAGVDWLKGLASTLERLLVVDDAVVLYREIALRLWKKDPLGETQKGTHFRDDDEGWNAWQAFVGDKRQKKARATALREDLTAPLRSWLAARVVRIFPVFLAAYELVKERRRIVDPLDLLSRLRDVLADDRVARGDCQGLFDQILVDEFQDTDPLQAEVLLYLCESTASAASLEEIVLVSGKLTLVGDPKQSIYRFRRADIETYEATTRFVENQGALRVSIAANLRSDPRLIAWFDRAFPKLFGSVERGRFDQATGEVAYEPLEAGRVDERAGPRVHALPLTGGRAEEIRRAEADSVARHLRWLVDASEEKVSDPDGNRRSPHWGDIAVLTATTTQLGLLFPRLDAAGIPYAAAGGRLFLQDPLVRRFALGLRALSDRTDGVAEAVLFRRPFFSVGLADLAQDPESGDRALVDVEAAREAVSELRRRRFDVSPGETARDLLERSGIGRATALGPNGMQRLSLLREVCTLLDRVAAEERLDFDGATERLRRWVDSPIPLDPPAPVGRDTVRVLTIHQAKGLEFPIVVLWDARATVKGRGEHPAWAIRRDASAWALNLEGLAWENPVGAQLSQKERRYDESERKRVTYVGATRARDLLVLAYDQASAGTRNHALVVSAPQEVRVFRDIPEPRPVDLSLTTNDSDDEEHAWNTSTPAVLQNRLVPTAVSQHVRSSSVKHEGRHGPQFGTAVHLAIGARVRGAATRETLTRIGPRVGLREHLVEEAIADAERAFATLTAAGLITDETVIEYPVSFAADDATLLIGSLDLVTPVSEEIVVIDFKTDTPSDIAPEWHLAQVRSYAQALLPLGKRVRTGLLYTADGGIRWV